MTASEAIQGFVLLCSFVPITYVMLVNKGTMALMGHVDPKSEPGHCRECGYDLRGSGGAAQVTCPECGEENALVPASTVHE
jgi:hypothetical protein